DIPSGVDARRAGAKALIHVDKAPWVGSYSSRGQIERFSVGLPARGHQEMRSLHLVLLPGLLERDFELASCGLLHLLCFTLEPYINAFRAQNIDDSIGNVVIFPRQQL